MSLIKSLLKESIKNLPEGSIKAQSVVPTLLKKGVKAEELEFAALELPQAGKVSKQQLVEAEAKRKDKFYTTETKGYQNISLPAGKNNPTYKMKVLSFKEQGSNLGEGVESNQAKVDAIVSEAISKYNMPEGTLGYDVLESGHLTQAEANNLESLLNYAHHDPASRYTSSHTDVPDYLAHTRIYDEDWDGAPVRVLQEIQSDLHQAGRQQGYDNPEAAELLAKGQELEQEFYDSGSSNKELLDELDTIRTQLKDLGVEVEDEMLNVELPAAGIPKSPQEKQWLRKGIERELVDAIEEGRTQLAIPISGDDIGNLVRAPGVQKWYETQVVNTAKKVAKASGSDFELVTKGGAPGTTYAVIKPKGTFVETNTVMDHLNGTAEKGKPQSSEFKLDKPFSFSLYSSPAAAAGVAYMAYQQGASEADVAEALESRGFSVDDISTNFDFIQQAVGQGATVQEAVKYLETKDVKAKTIEKKPPPRAGQGYGYSTGGSATPIESQSYGGEGTPRAAYDAIIDEQQNMTDEEVLSALMVIYPTMSSTTTTDLPSMLGFEEASQRYDKARASSRLRIQTLFEEKTGKPLGWNPGDSVWSEHFYVQDEQGNETEITPGFLNSLADSKFEILGGMGGGALGFASPIPGGAYGGSLAGSVAGAEADYVTAALRLQLDMDAESAAWKALNSGEMMILGEAVTYPVIKTLGYAWKGTSQLVKDALNGNVSGAGKALKETTFLNQDQIDEITTQVLRYTPLKGSKTEQSIQAVAMTQPGMEHAIAASSKYGEAGAALTETIKRRTKSILEATANLTDEQAPRMLGGDLQNYVADVKHSYGQVKARAVEAPKAAAFAYNFKELAIQPVLEETVGKIHNPAVKEKFISQMQRINKLTDSTGLGNLIELRQLTNDFLYNSNISQADKSSQAIRKVLGEIDGAIKDGAHATLDNPQQWLDDWAAVRSEYSEMKTIEQSSMYKAIMDKNGEMRAFSPDQVVKRLTKYITALDGSFEAVVSKLPIEGRKLYEGAVIDSLTNKYTMEGTAIHFPQLAKDLALVNFTTPENRAMKKVLTELGETFQNDVKIVNASTGMHIPSIMQGLSDNLLVKAKYEIASGTYAKLRSIVQPGVRHRIDLMQKVGQLIEAPLNQKAAKELLEAADGDVNLAHSVRALQQEAARAKAAGQDPVTPKLHFYGEGKHKRLKGDGPVTLKVPAHRIASIEKARAIAEGEYLTLDSKHLDHVLKQHGYRAIMLGSDSIRELK